MKNASNQQSQQSKAPAPHANSQRPENKDNLDDRGNLELTNAPTGHNKKEIKDGTKDEHNETRGQRHTK